MLKSVLFILILFSINQSVEIHSNNLKYLSKLFVSFQNKFKKVYKNSNEKNLRLSIFKNNSQLITAHNLAYKKGHTKYFQKINQFSDMTHEEYKQFLKRSGYKIIPTNPHVIKLNRTNIHAFVDEMPLSVDLRRGLTNIKDQQQCGSCWAFSANAAIEQAFYLKHLKIISLSEQQNVDCVYNKTYNSCEFGGYEQDGKKKLKHNS